MEEMCEENGSVTASVSIYVSVCGARAWPGCILTSLDDWREI